MSYPCIKCGLCCTGIGKHIEHAKNLLAHGAVQAAPIVVELAEFPYKYDETGRCENLAEDNTCKVYDTRPDICSIDKVYENHVKGSMTKNEFYNMNIDLCNEKLKEAGNDTRLN